MPAPEPSPGDLDPRPAAVTRRRRLTKLGAQGLALVLVAGATTAFAGLHKTVTVEVDGSPVQVTAFGRTVGQVLAAGDIEVGQDDLVAPGLTETVGDGGQIVVRNGRELAV